MIENREIIIDCDDFDNKMPELNLSVSCTPIVAKTRKLKIKYSLVEPIIYK